MRTTMVMIALLVSIATMANVNGTQLKKDYAETAISSPITGVFGAFHAHRQQNGVALSWNTVSPDAVHFIVQHSFDGVRFNDIGDIPAETSGWNKFKDDAALPGYNHYRIIAVKVDGSTEYSDVEVVRVVRHK
jgi:hypothetical protein